MKIDLELLYDTLWKTVSLFEESDDEPRLLSELTSRVCSTIGCNIVAFFGFAGAEGNLTLRATSDRTDSGKHKVAGWCNAHLTLSEGEQRSLFHENGTVLRAPTNEVPFTRLITAITYGHTRFGLLVFADTQEKLLDDQMPAHATEIAATIAQILNDASILTSGTHARERSRRGNVIKGQRAGEGSAIGVARRFGSARLGEVTQHTLQPPRSPEVETQRFWQAHARSLSQLEALEKGEHFELSEVASLIFSAHQMMLRDESLTDRIVARIDSGKSAYDAITAVVGEYAARFAAIEETRVAEKAHDIEDLGYRLLTNLNEQDDTNLPWHGQVALVHHIYPSDLARLSMEGVTAFVIVGSGVTAHVSILASSLGVPTLIIDEHQFERIPERVELLVDADQGRLVIDPSRSERELWRDRHRKDRLGAESYHMHGKTRDGKAITVLANVNLLRDALRARREGGEGIGLYRSEFPFILKNDFLTEQEQYRIYRAIVETHHGKPITLRTSDIGGDKLLSGRQEREDNPFLGVRGIRFSLYDREIFGQQLRAMLRAGYGEDLRIMVPMVSAVEELVETRFEIERAIVALESRGVPFHRKPRIGAMIELPSAALDVAELAKESDFLSIGTNDLTMYMLAVDRTNRQLSDLYRTYHPAVLRTLTAIVQAAKRAKTPVSVCGDAAADAIMIPFFIGIGVETISVKPELIEETKRTIATFDLQQAQSRAGEMLSIRRLSEMERYLQRVGQSTMRQTH